MKVETRVAIYARVSSADQNPEAQLTALREFAARRGFTVQREYVDHVTGDFAKRRKARRVRDQAYLDLLEAAGRREFDCVLVWKYDRFARSLGALITALEHFASLGIDFISCTQSIDTTTPMGKMFFHIIGSFAEFERAMIVERVNAGLKNARANGVVLGRPRNSAIEVKVRALRTAGKSIRQIATKVRRSPAGVMLILSRETNGI